VTLARPLLVVLLASPAAAFAALETFNVMDFGAAPDGHTMNTAAFARTVDACERQNGGTIVVPAGQYLTGAIELKSNMTLLLEPGSELLYSPNPADSPIVASRWESTNAFIHAPLVYAEGAHNVAITGRGTLNGQGKNWWWRTWHYDPSRSAEIRPAREAWLRLYDQIEAGKKLTAADFSLAADYLRPPLVLFNGCKNVLIEGVTVMESPMWIIHPLYCENVSIRDVTFISTGPNGDGIDIDSSRDVRISDCFFNTGDDCIVIKSGRNADGRRTNKPSENISISNCVMYRGHGAIAIGSETSGGIRDVVASNIVSKGTDYGIRIKSERGRGNVIENLRFSNFVIDDAHEQGIEITGYYENEPPEPFSARTPIFRNIAFANFTIVGAAHVTSIRGLPEKAIEQIRFTDMTATGDRGLVCEHSADVEFHNVRIGAASGSAFTFTHVSGIDLDGVTSLAPVAATPVIALDSCSRVWLHDSRAAPGTDIFVRNRGSADTLQLTGNELGSAKVDSTELSR
jgi:polygalacturonase